MAPAAEAATASPPPSSSAPVASGPAPLLAQQAASAFAKDAVLAWYRGEFAAANAVIDALCDHLAVLDGGGEYGAAFAAIARRRANWIPVLHMQKFFSVADVSAELGRVAEGRRMEDAEWGGAGTKAMVVEEADEGVVAGECEQQDGPVVFAGEAQHEEPRSQGGVDDNDDDDEREQQQVHEDVVARADSPGEDDGGGSTSSSWDQSSNTKLSGVYSPVSSDAAGGVYPRFCSDHAGCVARLEAVRACKRFVAKESVKGHMVNVVKGLKLYEDVFLEPQLSALAGYIHQLRAAGRRGDLPGETFIFFNKQLKGNKREVLQLGVPVFQSANEEAAPQQIDNIPPMLQDVIDHLVEWRLVPQGRKPNSCVINFFEEDDHSPPYFKPPHLDNPISTLLLHDTTMAFGRSLVTTHIANKYRGSLTLPLKQGSLLVMRGNSADMSRHVVCPTPNARVSITFLRVRPPAPSSPTAALQQHPNITTLWSPCNSPPPHPLVLPYGTPHCLPHVQGMPPPPPLPLIMLPPPPQLHPAPALHSAAGTGVFLPPTKKYVKHLPPRIQRKNLLSLPDINQTQNSSAQIPCIVV